MKGTETSIACLETFKKKWKSISGGKRPIETKQSGNRLVINVLLKPNAKSFNIIIEISDI